MTTEAFIAENETPAIKEALRSGIPASITMAQAIDESGSGNSRLYTQGNNSFGIKCHSDWYGQHIYANDDAPNECFRKYPSVRDSFRDHSDFLKKNSRYHFLFKLPEGDYIGWAKGLKAAGYATAPNYANSLLAIIKHYHLDQLDRKVTRKKVFRWIAIPVSLLLLALIILIAVQKAKRFHKLLTET